jgi:hypothetical protein
VLKKLVAIAPLCILFLHSAAQAGNVTGTVRYIRISDTGSMYFTLEGSPSLCTGAGSNSHVGHLVNSVDATRRDLTLSVLLSAKLSGKQVKVIATDNQGGYGCAVTDVYIDP